MCKVILKIFKGTSKKFCQLWNLFKFVSDVNFLGNYFKFVCLFLWKYRNSPEHPTPPKKKIVLISSLFYLSVIFKNFL